MKYTININQKTIVDMGLDVDVVDLAIYDCIISFMFTDKCRKVSVGDVIYYWVSSSLIITELPLIRITTERGISKRVDKLIECGLLERCPYNQSLKGTFYRIGKKYKEYSFSTTNDCSNLTWNESSNNNNTTNNNYKEKEDNKLSSQKKETINFDEIKAKWEEINPTLPSIRAFSEKRKKALQTLLKNNNATIDDLYKVFEIISVCSFCQGNNDRKWTATLDWVLNDTKGCFNRLLEGAYAFSDKEKQKVQQIVNEQSFEQQQASEQKVINGVIYK